MAEVPTTDALLEAPADPDSRASSVGVPVACGATTAASDQRRSIESVDEFSGTTGTIARRETRDR